MKRKRFGLFVFVVLVGAMAAWTAAAASLDPPHTNWAAPSRWAPPAAAATARTGVKTGLVTTYNPVPLIPITPCRVVDTRGNGFTGQWAPPSMPGAGT